MRASIRDQTSRATPQRSTNYKPESKWFKCIKDFNFLKSFILRASIRDQTSRATPQLPTNYKPESKWFKCIKDFNFLKSFSWEPPVGIKPTTYWLQVSCSISWAMEAFNAQIKQISFYLLLLWYKISVILNITQVIGELFLHIFFFKR